MSEDQICLTCSIHDVPGEMDGEIVPVWLEPSEFRDRQPDYVACTNCEKIYPFDSERFTF